MEMEGGKEGKREGRKAECGWRSGERKGKVVESDKLLCCLNRKNRMIFEICMVAMKAGGNRGSR